MKGLHVGENGEESLCRRYLPKHCGDRHDAPMLKHLDGSCTVLSVRSVMQR